MQSITVRSNGIMVAKLSGKSAATLMASAVGHWREYRGRKETTNCFEIDEDSVYTIENHYSSLKLYLWKGDVLIPE